ncbi:hypothetical protein, partial [Escherichia coli]|uniref:hypothetical protein n=1 Tax=Escherichia coli TaxID=562 RepID=UPI001C6FE5A6
QNHTDCPLTDFGGKTSIFSHPVYLFLRKFSLQDSRGGSRQAIETIAMTMSVYLIISLTISLLMNIYNRRIAIVER